VKKAEVTCLREIQARENVDFTKKACMFCLKAMKEKACSPEEESGKLIIYQ